MQTFRIEGRLPGLNEYTTANRSNAFAGAAMKKKAEKQIMAALQEAGLEPVTRPVTLNYTWVEQDNRRDQDNVAFAQKFVQDALVKAGILEDDSRRYVVGSTHRIITDKNDPHILVIITEE